MINKTPLIAPTSPWWLLLLEANSPKLLFIPNVQTIEIPFGMLKHHMPIDV